MKEILPYLYFERYLWYVPFGIWNGNFWEKYGEQKLWALHLSLWRSPSPQKLSAATKSSRRGSSTKQKNPANDNSKDFCWRNLIGIWWRNLIWWRTIKIQQIVWKRLMKFQRIPFENKGNVHHQPRAKTMPNLPQTRQTPRPTPLPLFTGSTETTVICHSEKLDVPRTVHGFKQKKH